MKQILFFALALSVLAMFSCKKGKPIPDGTMGTVTDVEGNVYKTVKIGDQWWMAENLKVEKLNDGTPIPNVELESTWSNSQLNDPMLCFYDKDKSQYKDKYGALYNWYAVNTGKLAPAGWHVPTDTEWQKLQDYLIVNGFNYDGSTVDNKIAKSLAAISGWTNSPTSGDIGNDQISNNKSSFNAPPAGFRNEDGVFTSQAENAFFWSSTLLNNFVSNTWFLNYNDAQLYNLGGGKRSGLSLRCVKD